MYVNPKDRTHFAAIEFESRRLLFPDQGFYEGSIMCSTWKGIHKSVMVVLSSTVKLMSTVKQNVLEDYPMCISG